MVDMHTHILPGADDGCADYGAALELVNIEIDEGVKYIVLTPHQDLFHGLGADQLKNKFLTFKQWFSKKGLDMKFVLGAEVTYSLDIIQRLNTNRFLTINETKIVLVQFPFKDKMNIEEVVWQMNLAGYQVIVSQIDRNEYLDIKDIEKIKNRGGLININADVFLDKKREKWVKQMVKEKLIDYVGSNIHDPDVKIHLAEAYQYVEKKYGIDYAKHIFYQNAKTMLIDRKTMDLE